jgi:hypothetical protein
MIHSYLDERNSRRAGLHSSCRRVPAVIALGIAVWLFGGPATAHSSDPNNACSPGDSVPLCGGAWGVANAPLCTRGLPGSRFDVLIDMIETTTGRELEQGWEEVDGGPGTIREIDEQGVLVISQTTKVHEDIEDLIAALRRARQLQFEDDSEESAQRPISLEVSRHAEQHRRIEQILSEPVELQFFNTELEQVFGFLRDEYQLPIRVAWQTIESHIGITSDTPVTVKFQNMSLRSALRHLLRELGLAYTIHDEMLVITSPEGAEDPLILRVYLVDDLATPETSEDADSNCPACDGD